MMLQNLETKELDSFITDRNKIYFLRSVTTINFESQMIFHTVGCIYSRALAIQKTAKRSTITTETEPDACIEIENHASHFSWLKWLAVWIMGACTQQQQ